MQAPEHSEADRRVQDEWAGLPHHGAAAGGRPARGAHSAEAVRGAGGGAPARAARRRRGLFARGAHCAPRREAGERACAGEIKLLINSDINYVLISVFSYLFKNKTIEDKSESEALWSTLCFI